MAELSDIRQLMTLTPLAAPPINIPPPPPVPEHILLVIILFDKTGKELIDYFKKLVLDGNILQFIFTTHSSTIIDKVDHTDMILFRKIYNK